MSEGWAIVTGASSGMGRVFAKQLTARGHPVLAVARRRERLDELASEVAAAGGRVEPLASDLSTADGVRRVASRAADLDINAGLATFYKLLAFSARVAPRAMMRRSLGRLMGRGVQA